MMHDEFRDWVENNDPPFVIKTQSGRSYLITDSAHIWMPPEYEGLACLVVRDKGVIVLRLASIESIHLEHGVPVKR